MTTKSNYQSRIRALLSPEERAIISKLRTPQKIQQFLDTIPINFEEEGETIFSPRQLLKHRRAHCIEGALFAATSLAYHGHIPMLMDFQTMRHDEDHVLALFKDGPYWGAISKTNHGILRWRDPVYKTYRELAMSYFHEYILPSGQKTLLTYSAPYDLRRYAPQRWVTSEEDLDWLVIELDDSRHFSIIPRAQRRKLLPATALEKEILKRPEWKPKA